MTERHVDNKEMVLGAMEFRNVAEVVSCGPMQLRTIRFIERFDLKNDHCFYVLSMANKVGNPFQVVCIRNLKDDTFIDVHGNKTNYRVVCIVPKNLDSIIADKNKKTKEDGSTVSLRTEMDMDDYEFIIDNCIMEEASMIINAINSLYILHGEENWQDIVYEAYS